MALAAENPTDLLANGAGRDRVHTLTNGFAKAHSEKATNGVVDFDYFSGRSRPRLKSRTSTYDADVWKGAPILTGTTRFDPLPDVKCIMVTGGAGFIGSWVARHLVITYPQAYHVVVFDKLDYSASMNNIDMLKGRDNFSFFRGDITNSDEVMECLKAYNVDAIFHFAAHTHVDLSFGNSYEFTRTNTYGTHVLLENAKEFGIRRFIHISTDEVYGETHGEDLCEQSILVPTNPYAASKAAAENMVQAYYKSFKVPVVMIRSNNVYGPHQFPEKIIPKFSSLLDRREKLFLHGDGQHTRRYLYAGDAADAFDTVLHRGSIGQIYNVGSVDEVSNMDLCVRLLGLFDLPKATAEEVYKWVEHTQDRPFNDRRYAVDATKLKGLGWQQKTSFEKGLKETVEWYRTYGQRWWGHISHVLTPFPEVAGKSAYGCFTKDAKRETSLVQAASRSDSTQDRRFLIWGGNGWVAGHLKALLEKQGKTVETTTVRMEDREGVLAELRRVKPTHVLNCAGCTGRPNVDWCEDNKEATIRSNVIGTLNLTDCCFLEGIHITVFATGCIYAYDEEHPIGGKGYVETDPANFDGSFYSATKSKVELLMKPYPNCLILRLRMPVSDDLHPRSFVTKITQYARVVNIPNSNSVLHDLLPAAILLAEHAITGVYNFTNPGAISHNDVLALFQKIVRPSFRWSNFSLDDQAKILKAGRSNCALDPSKLLDTLHDLGYDEVIPDVHVAYERCFRRMVANGVV